MNRILNIILLFMFTSGIYAQEISGSWSGSLNIQGTNLLIVFNITKAGTLYESTMDSPDQGAFAIPTTSTKFSDGKLEITATALGMKFEGELKDDSIIGTFKQGALSVPLTLIRGATNVQSRPQTPKEPFPYHSEQVAITSKDGKHTISGTFTKPFGKGLFPAIVLIAGSGPNDRDETLFNHKPFLVVSDHLTKNGFAVLRYDKRGVGKSTGSYADATIDDFAEDAKLALEFLKKRADIDKSKTGLLGHSEGGIVASMVAANNNDVNFIVLMAAPGIDGIEIVIDQNEFSMIQQKFAPDLIMKMQSVNKQMFTGLINWGGTENEKKTLHDRLSELWELIPSQAKANLEKTSFINYQFNAMITPGYRSFLLSKPSSYIQKIKCPVFAINGKLDSQVSATKNLNSISEALKKGGNSSSKTKIYEKLNHIFQESTTGLVTEYGKIEQTISPEVLSDITAWLKNQTK